MVTVDEWREILKSWSLEWLSTNEPFPPAVRRSGWLGYAPAKERQIATIENRLNYRLPPSLRAFLQTTNGWRRTSAFIQGIRPVSKFEWLSVEDPSLVEIWTQDEIDAPECKASSPGYYAYGLDHGFDPTHFAACLKIADPIPGDSAILLLNPLAVAEDGEWEAWFHASWIPGATRHPSFAHLMRAEYASFRNTELHAGSMGSYGPFQGTYAPDRPRHAAEPLGPGRTRPEPALTEDLINQLENSVASHRRGAARQLVSRFRTHELANEQTGWVPKLTRVLQSDLEPEVRSAAALMLGTYGDASAFDPLLGALEDLQVGQAALSALNYLMQVRTDPRVANAIVRLLESSLPTNIDTALHMLGDLRDPRAISITLRLLEGNGPIPLSARSPVAAAAAGAPAVDAFIEWLKHDKAEVRVAAAIGLRTVEDKRGLDALLAARQEPDPTVRRQIDMSISYLSSDDVQLSSNEILAMLQQMGIQLPDSIDERG